MKPMTKAGAISLPFALLIGALPFASANAAPSAGASLRCEGLRATIVGDGGTVRGTKGADVIVLRSASTVIAGAGDDIICGSTGADVILAGAGDDTIYGRAGADRIRGGADNDHIFGDLGDDTLRGESGADALYGGPGQDDLGGGSGENVMVSDGTAVTVRFTDSDIRDLVSTRQHMAAATYTGGSNSLAVLSSSGAPMMMNVFNFVEPTDVFLAVDSGPAVPGVVLSPTMQLVGVTRGTLPVVSISGASSLGETRQDRPDLAMANETAREVIGGRSGVTYVNGVLRQSPMTSVSLPPGVTAALPNPDTATIFITEARPPLGELVTRDQPSGATVSLASGNTVTLFYQNGRFVRG
jgi:Ca2+-binding RTX toxin-like protein